MSKIVFEKENFKINARKNRIEFRESDILEKDSEIKIF